MFKDDVLLKKDRVLPKRISTSSSKLTVCRFNIELGKKRAKIGAVPLRKANCQRAFLTGKVSEEGGGKYFIIKSSFRYFVSISFFLVVVYQLSDGVVNIYREPDMFYLGERHM